MTDETEVVAEVVNLLVAAEGNESVYQKLARDFNAIGTGY